MARLLHNSIIRNNFFRRRSLINSNLFTKLKSQELQRLNTQRTQCHSIQHQGKKKNMAMYTANDTQHQILCKGQGKHSVRDVSN